MMRRCIYVYFYMAFVYYLLFCGLYICVVPFQWCMKRSYLLHFHRCQVQIQSFFYESTVLGTIS